MEENSDRVKTREREGVSPLRIGVLVRSDKSRNSHHVPAFELDSCAYTCRQVAIAALRMHGDEFTIGAMISIEFSLAICGL